MASLKVAKNRNSLSRVVRDGLTSPVKKLTFDDLSDDDTNDMEFHPPVPVTSSSSAAAAADVTEAAAAVESAACTSTTTTIRKRIDFGASDADSDMDFHAEDAVPIDQEDGEVPHGLAASEDTPVKGSEEVVPVASTPKAAAAAAETVPADTPKDQKIENSAPPLLEKKSEIGAGGGSSGQKKKKKVGGPSPPRTRSGRIYKKRSLSPKPEKMAASSPSGTPKSSRRNPNGNAAAFHTIAQKKLNLKLNLLQSDLESTETTDDSCEQGHGKVVKAAAKVINEAEAVLPTNKRLKYYDNSDSEEAAAANSALIKRKQELPELPSPKLKVPPRLSYVKRPVSRLSWTQIRAAKSEAVSAAASNIISDDTSTPMRTSSSMIRRRRSSIDMMDTSIHGRHHQMSPSPPTRSLKQLRLSPAAGSPSSFVITSPQTAPRPRLLSLDLSGSLNSNRRASAPGGHGAIGSSGYRAAFGGGDAIHSTAGNRKRKQVLANINPFTATPTFESLKRRRLQQQQSTTNNSAKTSPENVETQQQTTPDQMTMTSSEMNNCTTPISNGNAPRFPAAPAPCSNAFRFNRLSNSPKQVTTPVAGGHNTSLVIPPPSSSSVTSSESKRRIRVSDMNINRYMEEFVELDEIASGEFGRVCVARHRLDGMVYAIKMTKEEIHGHTHEERVAMNEVFAHSALMKHKHVVRYYNSWVENGRIYIQNEFCEGGSLAAKIQELKQTGKRFSEADLKKILLHVAKGLQYIHSKSLVHLDIKPENIFIALEHSSAASSPTSVMDGDLSINNPEDEQDQEHVEANEQAKNDQSKEETVEKMEHQDDKVPKAKKEEVEAKATPKATKAKVTKANNEGHEAENDSTDSGNVTENHNLNGGAGNVHSMDEGVSYKIGDLGHVVSADRDSMSPEEGDCRYMAPELLMEKISRKFLFKADVFSLGLSMYEAASLVDKLPKNSLEDSMYEHYKAGLLPPIEGYSKDFNALIRCMVNPDPLLRPSVNRLIRMIVPRNPNHNNMKSRSQLYKELNDAKAKLRQLEQELEKAKEKSEDGGAAAAANNASSSSSPAAAGGFPTPPKDTPSCSEQSGSGAGADGKTSDASASETGAKSVNSSGGGGGTKMNLRQRPLTSKAANKKGHAATNSSHTPKAKSRRNNLRKRALLKEATMTTPPPPASKSHH